MRAYAIGMAYPAPAGSAFAEDFEHVQWDEEFHVEDIGPRDPSDGATFSDAGLCATPDYIMAVGDEQSAPSVRGVVLVVSPTGRERTTTP